MKAYGRNGTFQCAEIGCDDCGDGIVRVELFSKRIGQTPPVIMEFTHQEAMDFCKLILSTVGDIKANMVMAAHNMQEK